MCVREWGTQFLSVKSVTLGHNSKSAAKIFTLNSAFSLRILRNVFWPQPSQTPWEIIHENHFSAQCSRHVRPFTNPVAPRQAGCGLVLGSELWDLRHRFTRIPQRNSGTYFLPSESKACKNHRVSTQTLSANSGCASGCGSLLQTWAKCQISVTFYETNALYATSIYGTFWKRCVEMGGQIVHQCGPNLDHLSNIVLPRLAMAEAPHHTRPESSTLHPLRHRQAGRQTKPGLMPSVWC